MGATENHDLKCRQSGFIRRRQHRLPSGFSLIELLIVVAIIGIICAIAIPSLASSRAAANQASCVQSLRSYHSAQMTYQAGKSFVTDNLIALRNFGVDDTLGFSANNPIKAGYYFNIGIDLVPASGDTNLTAPTSSVTFPASGPVPSTTATVAPSYHIQANPVQSTGFGQTGFNGYYIDYSGVIHVKPGANNATVNDPPIGSTSGT